MKRIGCLLVIFMMLAGLTGCGRELSTEENRVIAEYAADLLLKYDKNYQSKYMNTEDETEAVTTTEQDTEATTEETVTEAVKATETVNTTEAEGEDSIIPPSDGGSVQDIAEIAGLDGLSIRYNRCMFLDRYPSIDQDGAFIYLDADEGYKLVVVKFNIANETAEDKVVDLLNTDLSYRLVMNQSKAAKPMLTILMDDLGTFSTTISANSEQSAVLVFQISDGLIDKIEHLDIRVTYQNEEHTIPIQ